MRLGSDALKLPESASRTPLEQLDRAHDEGLEGLFFRTMFYLSPSLDLGQLKEIRAHADELDMYLEAGLGRVNPYNAGESSELRAAGDGDTVEGVRRLMSAAAEIGITELWAETATIKPYEGRFAYDRFRTDVPWTEQIEGTVRFLRRIAPIATDLGIHVNLETHEEITTFELVHIVESVGPEAVGITFDTANVVQRAEHPVRAAERIAPYVRQTHIKDTGLFRAPDGIRYQMRPNGQGVVDLSAILPLLMAANPDLNLSLEVRDYGGAPGLPFMKRSSRATISLYDPEWLAGHPDLTVGELAAYLQLVQQYEDRIANGTTETYEAYASSPWGLDQAWAYVRSSRDHVREVAKAHGVALGTAPQAPGLR